MIYEYAVSPLLFKSLDNIGFLHEAFGLDNGRFISELPKKRKWVQIARHCIEEAARDDSEKGQLKELLIALEKRALHTRQGGSWNENSKWIDNVLTEHARRAFQGILHHERVTENSLAVGTPVTQRPRHGPGRAVFPHPVLRLYSLARRLFGLVLLPAVRLARVIPAQHVRHEFPLRAAYFRRDLPPVHGFPMLRVLCPIRHPKGI